LVLFFKKEQGPRLLFKKEAKTFVRFSWPGPQTCQLTGGALAPVDQDQGTPRQIALAAPADNVAVACPCQ
jgi:tRNA A37 threonylcarbamoyladenosine synthetase subunit TsaC/SUA5/YrdC